MGEIVDIYTDGGAIRNGEVSCIAGYGVYFYYQNEPFRYDGIVEHKKYYLSTDGKLSTYNEHVPATNNRAELLAILTAILKAIHMNMGSINIVSDSKYCIECIIGTKNIYTNQDMFEIINELCKKINATFTHVKGHTGKTDIHYLGNSIADALCRVAISTRKFVHKKHECTAIIE